MKLLSALKAILIYNRGIRNYIIFRFFVRRIHRFCKSITVKYISLLARITMCKSQRPVCQLSKRASGASMQFQTVGLQPSEMALESIMHPALSRLQEYRIDCPRVDRAGMTLHNVLSSLAERGEYRVT